MAEKVDFKQKYLSVLKEIGDVRDLPKADSKSLSVGDLGKGDVNTVCMVTDGKLTVIMKVAAPYIKCMGPKQPLDPLRLSVEYKSLDQYHQLLPGSVPRPIHYSQQHSAILMEYLDGYEDLRAQLMSGTVDKVAVQQLARNLATLHAKTHRTKLSGGEFQQMQETFRNERMCQLNEQYLFINPYIKDHPSNKVKPRLRDAAEARIYGNEALLSTVNLFKAKFITAKECLVHGDLHTGSVMVKDGVPKILDNEFSFVGPMAFDVGLLLAHYIVTYHQHMLTEHDNDAHRRVSYKMMDVIKDTVTVYLEELKGQLPGLSEQFAAGFMPDVAGFAGCELIGRCCRTIGATHAPDVEDSGAKEVEVMDSGLRLIQGHRNIDEVGRFLMIGLMLC